MEFGVDCATQYTNQTIVNSILKVQEHNFQNYCVRINLWNQQIIDNFKKSYLITKYKHKK